MAFFDKLGEMAKNIGDKTNDAIETSKLGGKIKAETEAAGEELKKIGAFYYERFAQSGEADSEVLDACQAAKAHYDAAAEAQAEIDRIKAENEAEKAASQQPVSAPVASAGITCPACGAANAPDTKFCCGCGAKLEAPAPEPAGVNCPACGAANASDTKFCCGCGTKLEAPAPEPAGINCPACGAANATGTKFCCECGAKLEAPALEPAPAEPEKKICPGCGTEVAPGVKFCPECGSKLE